MTENQATTISTFKQKFSLFCFAGFGGTAPMLLDLVTTLAQKSKGVSTEFDIPLFLAAASIAFIIGGIVGYAISCQENALATPLQSLMTGISAPALIMGAIATNQPIESQDISFIEPQENIVAESFAASFFSTLLIIPSAHAQNANNEGVTEYGNSEQNITDENTIKFKLNDEAQEKLSLPFMVVTHDGGVILDTTIKSGESISLNKSEVEYINIKWWEDAPGIPLQVVKRINVSNLDSNNIELTSTYSIKKKTIRKCKRVFFWKTQCTNIVRDEYYLNDIVPKSASEEE